MGRFAAIGLFAAALACGGAPGRNIGWLDSLSDVDTTSPEGAVIDFSCPAGGSTSATVWGTGVYTDDSAICVAAVHAGKITAYNGGTATLRVEAGQASYTGSTSNGVSTLDYASWPRSFRFP